MPISSHFVAKLLLFFFFLSPAFIHQSNSLQFEYKNFTDSNNIVDHFIFDGSQGDSRIYKGALQVTRDTSNPSDGLTNSSGRIVYKKEFRLWKNGKNGSAVVASFNTTIVINIVPMNGSGGEGLAFILASNRTLPENSHGRWMGIANEASDGNASNQILAIEFDTRKSSSDDVDGNHVGVDVNGIRSMVQVPLAEHGVNLTGGTDVIASIVYDGMSKNLSIFVATGNNTSAIDGSNPVISSLPLDLSKFLMEDVYIGFSGSTGDQSNITQLNCIRAWSFLGTDITDIENKFMLILWSTIGAFVGLVIACALVIFTCWRKRKSDRIKLRQKSIQVISMLDGSPRKFKLKELRYATCNFHPKNKLGEGGFGTVYKGVLKDTKQKVAVKRVSKDSKQGEQEFINEITTIGKLSHKNLVKLIGWCYKSENDFLLVYEFMPNGSLDKLLFSYEKPASAGVYSDQLSWDKRHNIIKGVAHALCYLHNGCAKRVFHRDVKSSNVMLDANFDARLGDFGLARAVQQDDKTHHTTGNIFGTPGYVAPEYFLTGRANGETDVYGFGVFIMEVASGRRPFNIQHHGHGPAHGAKIGSNVNEIVNWLWELHGRGRIVDAVDPTLGGVFDQKQVECVLRLGLACCHPNPNERPTMRLATQVLIGEASTPEVPAEKPAFMWPVVNISIASLEEFSNIDLDEPTNVN